MSIERIEFNSDGFAAFLKSDGVRSLIEGHTNAVKGRADAYIAGESQGFNSSVKEAHSPKYGGRWVGTVGTSDRATVIAESENKALTKAVHGS